MPVACLFLHLFDVVTVEVRVDSFSASSRIVFVNQLVGVVVEYVLIFSIFW